MRILTALAIAFSMHACSDYTEQQLTVDIPQNSLEDSSEPDEWKEPIYVSYQDSLSKAEAIDSIWNCLRVQELESEIRQASSDTRHLTIIPIDQPDKIIVKLAEDNGANYVTHLIFHITPSENWKIEYYNPVDDERIDLQLWEQGVDNKVQILKDLHTLKNATGHALLQAEKDENVSIRMKYRLPPFIYRSDGSYMGYVYFYDMEMFEADSSAIYNFIK